MAIPYLPPEVMTDIFLRLPVETLSNARFVNKYWFHFISSSRFARAHLRNSTIIGSRVIFSFGARGSSLKQFSLDSLLCDSSSEYLVNDIELPMNCFRPWCVGSCDGLVFLLHTNHNLLWNPCTRKYDNLPCLDVDEEEFICITYGFGYDESTDDYKVVAICLSHDETRKDHDDQYSIVKVCSVKGKSWKRIQDFKGWVQNFYDGKFACGKLHWFTSLFELKAKSKIATFDVGSEVFEIVELPIFDNDYLRMSLDVLDGCICLLVDEQRNVDLWVLKEYGAKESWTKTLTFSCANIPGTPDDFKVYSVLPNGEILFRSSETFAVYNPKDNSYRFPDLKRLDCGYFKPLVYVQSLISPAPAGTGMQG